MNVDTELWKQYWFAMVDCGVMAQAYWWGEQWTISVRQNVDGTIILLVLASFFFFVYGNRKTALQVDSTGT